MPNDLLVVLQILKATSRNNRFPRNFYNKWDHLENMILVLGDGLDESIKNGVMIKKKAMHKFVF